MIRRGFHIADSAVALPDAAPMPPLPIEVLVRTTAPPAGASVHPTMIEESFRTLRTNLLVRRESDTRTFVITSAMPSEGKSTIAANLACSLAAVRKRVLLIDADLRRPAIHKFFGIPNNQGLTDVLRGASAEHIWQETSHGPVVLTSGPMPEDPQRLFESDHFSRLMSEVRSQFDLVLIDSAPLLAVADTSLIVPHADAAVLVLRYAGVSEGEASLAVERLRAAHGKLIGCVLSQVTETTDSYHAYADEYVKRA